MATRVSSMSIGGSVGSTECSAFKDTICYIMAGLIDLIFGYYKGA